MSFTPFMSKEECLRNAHTKEPTTGVSGAVIACICIEFSQKLSAVEWRA